MVAPEQVAAWKSEYGAIYSLEARGVEYIYREVTTSEYDAAFAFSSKDGSAEAEDQLVILALLHPEEIDFNKTPAGVISVLAKEILDVSGFGEPERAKEILDTKREEAGEFRGLMKAFIMATMPYKEEELNDLNFSQLAAKVALSEQIIKVNQAVVGIEGNVFLDIIDPNEQQTTASKSGKSGQYAVPGQAGPKDPIAEKLKAALEQ